MAMQFYRKDRGEIKPFSPNPLPDVCFTVHRDSSTVTGGESELVTDLPEHGHQVAFLDEQTAREWVKWMDGNDPAAVQGATIRSTRPLA